MHLRIAVADQALSGRHIGSQAINVSTRKCLSFSTGSRNIQNFLSSCIHFLATSDRQVVPWLFTSDALVSEHHDLFQSVYLAMSLVNDNIFYI